MEGSQTISKPRGSRRRSLTSVTLQWIAERIKRSEKVKQEISSGTYCVDTRKVACSILNQDD